MVTRAPASARPHSSKDSPPPTPPSVARLLTQLDQAITACAGEPVRIALAMRVASPLQDQSARAWAQLVQDALRERFPQRTSELPTILALHPHGAPFVDIFVGPAGPDKWATVRADQTHTPIAQEPATPSPEQLERLRLMTQRWSRAAKDETAAATQAPRDASHDRPSKRGVTILALGGVVLAATTIGLLISRAGGKDGKPQNPILIGADGDPAPRAQSTPPTDAADAGTLRQRLDREARALSILTPKAEDEDAAALASANTLLQSLRTQVTAGERGGAIEQGLDALAQQRTALERQLRERAAALVDQAKTFATTLKQPALRTAAEDRARAWTSEDDPKQLRAQLTSFREAMTLADTSLASATSTDPTQGVTDLRRAGPPRHLADQADRHRQSDRASRDDPATPPASAELAQELSAWRTSATSFVSDAQRIQAGLNQGAMLDEPLPGADGGDTETVGTLRELARRARASRVQQDVPGLIDGALRRIDRLAEITASADRVALADTLRAARSDSMTIRASESREAFERVLALAGNDAKGVRDARDVLTRDVIPTLARVANPARAAALQAGASRGLVDAWATRVRASAANRPALSELLALAPELGVDRELLRTLPREAQRVLAEDRLAHAVTKAGKDDTLVARAAADFLAALRELPDDATPAAPDELEKLCVAAQPGVPTPQLLSTLGPASAGWTLLTHDEAGTKLVFEKQGAASSGGDAPRLAFERQPSMAGGVGGGNVTYLATTELSVGALLAVANDAATSDKILPLLWQFTPGVSDPRDGPRTWEWTDASKRALRVPEAWLRPLPIPRTGAYAESIRPGSPSPQSPAQYLSPQASEAIASAMGCRLPTAEEWLSLAREACKQGELLACASGANLRDATWAQQAAHVQSKGTSTVALPAAGIATPDGVPSSPRPET